MKLIASQKVSPKFYTHLFAVLKTSAVKYVLVFKRRPRHFSQAPYLKAKPTNLHRVLSLRHHRRSAPPIERTFRRTFPTPLHIKELASENSGYTPQQTFSVPESSAATLDRILAEVGLPTVGPVSLPQRASRSACWDWCWARLESRHSTLWAAPKPRKKPGKAPGKTLTAG